MAMAMTMTMALEMDMDKDMEMLTIYTRETASSEPSVLWPISFPMDDE